MKRRLLRTGRRFALILTFSALLITNSCKKTNSTHEIQAQKENLSINEIKQWGTTINNTFAKPANIRYDKAQKTFYNNRFYIRVPVDSSTGYFYFTRTSKGLQPLFIRYHASGKVGDGLAEFIDFDTRKFYKGIAYQNYQPQKQYTLSNAPLFFNHFFAQPDINTRKTLASSTTSQKIVGTTVNSGAAATVNAGASDNPGGCPVIDPASVIPPLLSAYNNDTNGGGGGGLVEIINVITDLAAQSLDASGGPGKTDCWDPDHQTIWQWIANAASNIGEFFSNLFGGSGDTSSDGSNYFPYPNILLEDNNNPVNNNLNSNPTYPNPNNTGYGGPTYNPSAPPPPNWYWVDPNITMPATPQPYSLTEADKRIWKKINEEDAGTDAAYNKNCQGTLRAGNAAWPGNIEHWMIMMDYVIHNPLVGEIEYQIPGAGMKNSRPGYIDMVNTLTGEMFEIKPDNPAAIDRGLAEIIAYLAIAKSPLGCPRTQEFPWVPGYNYPTRTLLPYPKDPTKVIEARLAKPGVVAYNFVKTDVNPLPVLVPISLLDKLKKLVEKLKSSFQPADVAIAQFLNDPANADLVRFVKNAAITAGVVIIVGTLVEDILTAGVGIADDWASFILAYRIIRFATAL